MNIEPPEPHVVKSIFCTSKGCIMNIEPLVSFAASLMESASKGPHVKLHLCYFEKKLQCLPVKHTIHRHVILFTFRAEDWPKGLHAQEWDQIRKAITNITKELELCMSKIKTTKITEASQSKTSQQANVTLLQKCSKKGSLCRSPGQKTFETPQ